jgi:hypothetical protein
MVNLLGQLPSPPSSSAGSGLCPAKALWDLAPSSLGEDLVLKVPIPKAPVTALGMGQGTLTLSCWKLGCTESWPWA